jgi:hypothetical protein
MDYNKNLRKLKYLCGILSIKEFLSASSFSSFLTLASRSAKGPRRKIFLYGMEHRNSSDFTQASNL